MTKHDALMARLAERCLQGQLPTDYLVLDLETSGLIWGGDNPDVIVQVGYAAVSQRKIVKSEAHYVKRPAGTMHGRALEINGITDEMLQAYGREPAELYPQLAELFNCFRKSGCIFVGHNLVAFDSPFMSSEFAQYGVDFHFKPEELLDTGCIFKASRLGELPRPAETLGAFLRRVRGIRSRTKWGLSHVAAVFDLFNIHKLDLDGAHDAGFDCRLTHLALEAFRSPEAGAIFERFS